MNHKKIAKLAKVSTSTVSKALADSKEINSETIREIKQIAEETGYFNERKERRKRSSVKSSPTIAVLCPEIISTYYASIITNLHNETAKFGARIATYICGFDNKSTNILIKDLSKEEGVDAIVCFNSEAYDAKLPIPLLYMQQIDKNAQHDAVYSSTFDIMDKATSYLNQLGHTDIGFIGEINTREKLDMFKKSISLRGLELREEFIYVVEKRFEQIGYEAVRQMLDSGNIPTAFVAAYDEVALGAIHALRGAGYTVPGNISFVGINDIPISSYMDTPLTSIGSHMGEQCSIAADLLKRKIQDPDFKAVQHITVQSELIIRQTTAERKAI